MADDFVLVTGASGYIATHIVQLLQQCGHRVRGTVRSLQNEEKVKPLRQLCPEANYPLELVEADLTIEESWVAAVKGCKYVFHVASPFPAAGISDDELVKTAVNGTLAVLKACDKGVKRVVITSSIAAVNNIFEDRPTPYTEDDWTDVKFKHGPYVKSKTLAEKAAWDYVQNLPEEKRFELAVVNPGFVFGPVLCGHFTGSAYLPHLLLSGSVTSVLKIGMGMVDVRDVALAHCNAMMLPEAAGKRHILVTETLSMKDMAMAFQAEFTSHGYSIPTSEMPNYIALESKEFQPFLPGVGKKPIFDKTRMCTLLGIKPRSMKNMFTDMAYSMIEAGLVRKTDKYTGPTYSE